MTLHKVFGILSLTIFSAQIFAADPAKAVIPLNDELARNVITQYYNKHSMWTSSYVLQSIKRIKLQPYNARRVVAHVEYSYLAKSAKRGVAHGVDKRTFLLILRNGWEVISMGPHLSGKL